MNHARLWLGTLTLLLSATTILYGHASFRLPGDIDLFFTICYAVGVIGFLLGVSGAVGD